MENFSAVSIVSDFSKYKDEDIDKLKGDKVVIGTHSGHFHADETLAIALLLQTDSFKHAEIWRSRVSTILNKCTALVDVGAIYDPDTHRFDHHQRTFEGTFSAEYTTKLSSAGLIYKHFGKEILKKELKDENSFIIDLIFNKLYEVFVEAIDAYDNGIDQYPTDIVPAFTQSTHLTSRIRMLNPKWNEKNQRNDKQFRVAMDTTYKEFLSHLHDIHKSWLPAREVVRKDIEKRFEIDPSGEIVVLSQLCPWTDHLFQLEKEFNLKPIQYVIYEGGSKMWRVQAVPIRVKSFELRTPLHSNWRGLNDDDLICSSGIPGSVFVHNNGWIGGNRTLEGAIAMAQKSIKQN